MTEELHVHDEECVKNQGDQENTCHFCGTHTCREGYEFGKDTARHFLSDCRPDLVKHEIGETCTWAFRRQPLETRNGDIIPSLPQNETCYAYQNLDQQWTNEHIHFYEDGPM